MNYSMAGLLRRELPVDADLSVARAVLQLSAYRPNADALCEAGVVPLLLERLKRVDAGSRCELAVSCSGLS